MLPVKASDKVLRLRNLYFRTFIPIMLNLEELSALDKLSRFVGDKVKTFPSDTSMIRENGTEIGDCWLERSSPLSPKSGK